MNCHSYLKRKVKYYIKDSKFKSITMSKPLHVTGIALTMLQPVSQKELLKFYSRYKILISMKLQRFKILNGFDKIKRYTKLV